MEYSSTAAAPLYNFVCLGHRLRSKRRRNVGCGQVRVNLSNVTLESQRVRVSHTVWPTEGAKASCDAMEEGNISDDEGEGGKEAKKEKKKKLKKRKTVGG